MIFGTRKQRRMAVLTAAPLLLTVYILLPDTIIQYIRYDAADLPYKPDPISPITAFMYIKLHRVGSGSMHNILVRFALRYKKFIALVRCANYQIFPNPVSTKSFLPKPTHPDFDGYDMYIDHTVHNKAITDTFLPPATVYITQIRHPFYTGFSAYEHFFGHRYYKLNGKPMSYNKFLERPETYDKNISRLPVGCGPTKAFSVTRNIQSLELGYPNQASTNTTDFRKYLAKLDKEILHVSILEKLDESLVLLKRKMHWKMADIVRLPLHSGSKRDIVKDQQQLELDRQRHRRWSSLDYVMYEHFSKRLQTELNKQSYDFYSELKIYTTIQSQFRDFCRRMCDDFNTKGIVKNDTWKLEKFRTALFFNETLFNPVFNVTYADCLFLKLEEPESKMALKFRQYPGVCGKKQDRMLQITGKMCDPKSHIIPGIPLGYANSLVFNIGNCKRLYL